MEKNNHQPDSIEAALAPLLDNSQQIKFFGTGGLMILDEHVMRDLRAARAVSRAQRLVPVWKKFVDLMVHRHRQTENVCHCSGCKFCDPCCCIKYR